MTATPSVATLALLASLPATMPTLPTKDANFPSPNSPYLLMKEEECQEGHVWPPLSPPAGDGGQWGGRLVFAGPTRKDSHQWI